MTLVEVLHHKPGGLGFDSQQDNGPEVDSAYNRTEYQEYFLEVKVADA